MDFLERRRPVCVLLLEVGSTFRRVKNKQQREPVTHHWRNYKKGDVQFDSYR